MYYLSPARGKALALTLVSYIFYGWWNPWFVFLMLGSTAVDYYCGKLITADSATARQRKTGVITSVITNLSVLAFFKYAAFFASNLEAVGIGIEMPEFLYRVVLPVGISFYTFQSMSYSIDLYRGHARPARNFVDFACYVAMFPQLVAGPIVRYGSVADQLVSRRHTVEGFVAGFTRFNYGFAKKILIANNVGTIADACFSAGTSSLSPGMAWLGVLAYAFQIYFDFSAYSDMAIGLGRMFGFQFPENFNSPYRSKSITEFWRRWHISLSSFLRDYLYIPLGGNRIGVGRTYINLFLVMLIGGLWHGAQWTFVIWGIIHGIMLTAERLAGEKLWLHKIPSRVRMILTFLILLITWVFFRADNLSIAMNYLSAMFFLCETGASAKLLQASVIDFYSVIALVVAAAVTWLLPRTADLLEKVTLLKCIIGLVLLLVAVRQMFYQGFNPFLYFQF
ncbi:MAG: MBOAT family protein [Verrucomicrobiales bacterium]|nr:MBOAT family protein [Verrucomicrobiales bacterium]